MQNSFLRRIPFRPLLFSLRNRSRLVMVIYPHLINPILSRENMTSVANLHIFEIFYYFFEFTSLVSVFLQILEKNVISREFSENL